ncbi:hypothetical protein LJB86_01480 [Deltaproteobacteria bacterium OttesenSCG-928-M10]|nr:hypothetical protein [Deltaproteobacteria bacterium OttesenSCG-928-M10]
MQYPNTGFVVEREFSVGAVIARTFSTILQNPVVYLGLAFVAVLPVMMLMLFTVDPERYQHENLFSSWLVGVFLIFVVSTIMTLLIQGSIAYAVYHSLMGEAVSIGEALSGGLSNIVPILGAAILTGLCVGLGFMVLVVPGFILLCMLSVTTPACAVEGTGVLDSMSRSANLTKGHRWKIFGLLLIMWIANAVIEGAVESILIEFSTRYELVQALGSLAGLITTAFSGVMFAIVYYDLRVVKEGVSLDALTKIFD